MKKLLIIDIPGKSEPLKRRIEGTEVTVVRDSEQVLKAVKSVYSFDEENFKKNNPLVPWSAPTAGFNAWLRRRRDAELVTRNSYWDAALFYVKLNNESDLLWVFGATMTLATSGCKFISIYVYETPSLLWWPEMRYSDFGAEMRIGEAFVILVRNPAVGSERWTGHLMLTLSESGLGDAEIKTIWPGLDWLREY